MTDKPLTFTPNGDGTVTGSMRRNDSFENVLLAHADAARGGLFGGAGRGAFRVENEMECEKGGRRIAVGVLKGENVIHLEGELVILLVGNYDTPFREL